VCLSNAETEISQILADLIDSGDIWNFFATSCVISHRKGFDFKTVSSLDQRSNLFLAKSCQICKALSESVLSQSLKEESFLPNYRNRCQKQSKFQFSIEGIRKISFFRRFEGQFLILMVLLVEF
jgi:hypothetical protein